jgi:hypothetical protein
MNVCIKVHNVCIHWYIMYKYDIQNMYDGGEYDQCQRIDALVNDLVCIHGGEGFNSHL